MQMIMSDGKFSTSSVLDETSLKLNLMSAKSKLNKALLAHYSFRPCNRELLELSRDFEQLKEEGQMLYVSKLKVVPQLNNISLPACHSDNEQTSSRVTSLSAYHAQAVAGLQDAIDMHSSCVYLLELHQAISSLETAVNQLCQCVKKRPSWDIDELADDEENWAPQESDDWDPLLPAMRVEKSDEFVGNASLTPSDNEEIDADYYRLCTDAVLLALEEAENRFAQSTKFSKDNVSIFQGFRRTLVQCKTRLAEHVDVLWRRWIVLRSYNKSTESFPGSIGLSSELLSQLQLTSASDPLGFLFTANLPTVAEVAAAVRGSIMSESNTLESPAILPCERGSAVMASFTVYARPDLLIQLFRLVDALKESKARFTELSSQLNKYIFLPWLSKVSCTEGSNSVKFWPTFETHLIDVDPGAGLLDDALCGDHVANKPTSGLTPVWQLELISPATVADEEEQLILDSCRQLAGVFQELSTHLFGLPVNMNDENCREDQGERVNTNDDDNKSCPRNRMTRVIDVAMNTGDSADYFDDTLVARLIDGRFAAGLPSAGKCNSASFLVPVTQAIYRLAMEGQTTGFLTGNSSDNRKTGKALPDIAGTGGASLLLHWLSSLSTLTQQTRSNEIIDQVRMLLSNVEYLRKTHVVGDRICPRAKRQTDNDDLAFDDADSGDSRDGLDLDGDEVQIYRKQAAEAADQENSKKQSYFIPSLGQLLESQASREDLARFLDFGHFHFPLSRVSKTTIRLLEQINAVIAEIEILLRQKFHAASSAPNSDPASSAQIQLIRSSALALIESLVELVPRMILLFTSLIPVFHASLLDSDLYVAALYHNNCMYLAHECLTLGELRLFPLLGHLAGLEPRAIDASGDPAVESEDESTGGNLPLLRRTVSCSTFVLVPQLRVAGTELLLVHLRRQRTVLSDYLKRTKGLKDISLPENRQRCTEALTACQTTLMSVAEGLSPLPLTVFSRCIGYLCNFVCTEVVRDVLALLDLTQTDSEVLADLLTELERTIIHIFNAPPDVELVLDKTQAEAYVNSLARRVPELARLRGILSVLTASTMAVIERVLWNNGQGPLSTVARLEPSELRGLVAALYSKSAARDQLLRQLR